MDPVTASAIIQGGSQVVGGLAGKHGAGKAAELQYRSAQDALAFEREQEATRKAEYEKQQAALKAQWDAEQARREPYRQAAAALLAKEGGRLGLGDIAKMARPATMPEGWTPATGATSSSVPATLGGLASYQQGMPASAMVAPPQLTLANLANWNTVARGY